ncbi:hypothetical protein Tco_0978533 [Tanacetum coccineum]|uniref:Uncharacterized protein n=1 Tax=Tanacetum coccineum TaxID=301880 RepID=A0ABQ5EN92_9ASTR
MVLYEQSNAPFRCYHTTQRTQSGDAAAVMATAAGGEREDDDDMMMMMMVVLGSGGGDGGGVMKWRVVRLWKSVPTLSGGGKVAALVLEGVNQKVRDNRIEGCKERGMIRLPGEAEAAGCANGYRIKQGETRDILKNIVAIAVDAGEVDGGVGLEAEGDIVGKVLKNRVNVDVRETTFIKVNCPRAKVKYRIAVRSNTRTLLNVKCPDQTSDPGKVGIVSPDRSIHNTYALLIKAIVRFMISVED